MEVAIDPAELEGLDEEGVRALYEERLAQQQSTASREVSRSALPHLCIIPYIVSGNQEGAPRAAAAPRSLRGHSFLSQCPLTSLSLRSLLDCAGSLSYRALLNSPYPLDIALPSRLTLAVHHFLKVIYDELAHGLQQASAVLVCAQNFADMVAAKAVQQKRKAAERKEGKAKKAKESFKF